MPQSATNKPIITRSEGLVNKNRICLKSYVKTEDFRGFQLVKYEKGYMLKQEGLNEPGGQDRTESGEPGQAGRKDKERKKQRKKRE